MYTKELTTGVAPIGKLLETTNTFDRTNGSQISTNRAAFREVIKFYNNTVSRLPLTIKNTEKKQTCIHRCQEKENSSNKLGNAGIQ